MEEYVNALKRLAENPSEIGNGIFDLFLTITNMNWAQVTALGTALELLITEVFEANDRNLTNPTYRRLRAAMGPVVVRIGTLIMEAEPEKRDGLISTVELKGRGGFVDWKTVEGWRKTMLPTVNT